MKQLKKTSLLVLLLLATQIWSLHAQSSFSKQLKETNKMTIFMYDQLIRFVLTKDTVYHVKAMAVIDAQKIIYTNLKREVEDGSIYGILLSGYMSSAGANKTLYDKYFKERILNDNDKTKELKYEDMTYNVTKYRQKEFNNLLSEMKTEQKRNK